MRLQRARRFPNIELFRFGARAIASTVTGQQLIVGSMEQHEMKILITSLPISIAKGTEIPKYRTFSLWRAGYSLDGYGTTIDRWLDGTARDEDLDYVPSDLDCKGHGDSQI